MASDEYEDNNNVQLGFKGISGNQRTGWKTFLFTGMLEVLTFHGVHAVFAPTNGSHCLLHKENYKDICIWK